MICVWYDVVVCNTCMWDVYGVGCVVSVYVICDVCGGDVCVSGLCVCAMCTRVVCI